MTVVDTSVVVAALTLSDPVARRACEKAVRASPTPISHVMVESYSVLTRLPSHMRMTGPQVGAFILQAFPQAPLVLPSRAYRTFVSTAVSSEIIGGAIYDALIALTAKSHGEVLLTRDRRAAATYAAFGASIEFVE